MRGEAGADRLNEGHRGWNGRSQRPWGWTPSGGVRMRALFLWARERVSAVRAKNARARFQTAWYPRTLSPIVCPFLFLPPPPLPLVPPPPSSWTPLHYFFSLTLLLIGPLQGRNVMNWFYTDCHQRLLLSLQLHTLLLHCGASRLLDLNAWVMRMERNSREEQALTRQQGSTHSLLRTDCTRKARTAWTPISRHCTALPVIPAEARSQQLSLLRRCLHQSANG